MRWVGIKRSHLNQARSEKGQTSSKKTKETSERQNRASSVNSTGDNLILQLCLNQKHQSVMNVTTVMPLYLVAMEALDLEDNFKTDKR